MTPRARGRTSLGPIGTALVAALALAGCGGGGGGGGGTQGALVGVSFVGYLPTPGSPTLPPVFRDQALEFEFDGPLDSGVLGGFFEFNGAVAEFTGVAPSGTTGIPYYAFVNQTAARTSLQIILNAAGGGLLPSYIVGRHKDKSNVIVVDPFVVAGNLLGVPPSVGFAASTTYVYRIPSGNEFRFGGGVPAQPQGAPGPLPIPVPPFSTQPSLSLMFFAGTTFGPSPIAPAVVSIVSLSGATGTDADPIPEADSFVITFSKLVTLASVNPLVNFVVRNVDVTNTSYPNGIIVPGSIVPLTPGALFAGVYVFTPVAPYGPGAVPGSGFRVEVRIGTFGDSLLPPILGVPQGVSGTQLALSNSLSQTFRTIPCSGCSTPATIIEGFTNTVQRDPTFVQSFPNSTSVPGPQQCRWNDASAPGQLAGRFLSGSSTGNNPQTLGTRVQVTVAPTPLGAGGLFSPFDATLANSGGQCPAIPTGCNLGINQGGGSHIMHVYEAAELGNTEDSLEQIEWSPASGVTAPSVYPSYKIWCGITSTAAPQNPPTGPGLTAVFDNNYNLTPYQAGIPLQTGCAPATPNPRKVPCGGPAPYPVLLATTQFYPFPKLFPCFDYATSTGGSGTNVNLLFEQDIDPGNQVPNFNSYKATGFNPVRRLLDAPLVTLPVGLCAANNGGQFDVYKHRFTFVGLVAQCRSLWYDTGAPDPVYLAFLPSPPVSSQPPGTESTWTLEGTDVANPTPATNGVSGIYINAAGVINPAVLTTISGLRYFRFKVDLRGNNVTNQTPAYTGVSMGYNF